MSENRTDEMIVGRVAGRCCVHECGKICLPHWSVCLEHALRIMLVDVPAKYWQFGHVFPFRPDADGKAASVLFVPACVRAEALAAAWALIAADRMGNGQTLASFRDCLGRLVASIEDPARQEAVARVLTGRPEVDRQEDDGAGAWPAWTALEAWAANVLYARGWLLYPPGEDQAEADRNVGDAELHKTVAMLRANLDTSEAAHVEAMKERDEALANFKHAYDVAIRWEQEARRGWSIIREKSEGAGLEDFAAEMERRAEEIREGSAQALVGAEGLLEDVFAAVDAAMTLEKNPRVRRELQDVRGRLAAVREERPRALELARSGDALWSGDDLGLLADPPVEFGEGESIDPGSDVCGYCGAVRVDHLGVVQRCPEVDQGGFSMVFDAHPEPFDRAAPSFVVGVKDPDDLNGDVCKRCSFLREDHDNTGKALVCPKVNEVVDAAADVGPLYPGQTVSMFEGCEGRPELCVWCGSNVEAHVGGLCPVQHGQGRTVPAPAPVEAEVSAGGAEVEDPSGSETLYTEPRSLPFGEGFKNRLDLVQEKTEEKTRCEVGAKGPLTAEVWAEVAGGTLGHEKLVQYVVQWVKSYPCAASIPLRQVCEVYDAWRKSAPMSGSVNVCESLEGIRRAVSERRWLLNGSQEFHQAVIGGLVFEAGASEHLATYKANAWLERLQLVFVTRLVDSLVASVEGDVRVLEVESFGLVRAGIVAALAGSCDHVRSVDPWAECIETSEAAAGYRGARDRAVKVALGLVEGLVRS